MIPILYEANEISFTTNGLCRLRDCISCVVTEERNGIYECDFDYPIDGANFDLIQCGRIIAVKHDDSDDIQPFDIISYSKPINGIVSFHAVHISYRLRGMTVSGTNINSLSDALTMLATATPSNQFTYEADYDVTAYMSAADGTPRTVRQMLGGVEGSILDTYGGEFEWDDFIVKIHKSRGKVADLTIRYGLNMLKYDEDMDYSGSYTSCIPYWSGDDGNGGTILVKGNKVDSGLVPYNGIDKCIPLDLSQKFENAPTVAQLESLALSMMTSNAVSLPKQSIKVDFIRLNDFEEYKQFEVLLQCKLCDQIEVVFPDYQMSGYFKIVRTIYDVLEERFSSMELGSLSTTLAEALGIGESASNNSGGSGFTPYFGECSTAGGTATKEVTVTPSISSLQTGMIVYVKFTNANAVANPTLNVNGTGAIAIRRYGTTAPSTSAASSWNAGSVVSLLYDGTDWQMIGFLNTTYSGMTDDEYQAGTSTTNRLITPARLKSAILYHATPSNIGAVALADKYIRSSGGGLDWTSQADGEQKVISKSALAYWNGTYSGTNSNLTRCSQGHIIGRNQICYANSRVDNFSNGQITVTNASLGVTTGAKPVGIILTPSSSNVAMRYNYDGSDATNSDIRAYNLDGSGFSGNLRYFCVVFQNTWTST